MIFLDTSFIVAYYNKDDVHNEKAQRIMKKILSEKDEMMISDHIFDEVINVLINRLKGIDKIKEIGEDLINFTKMIHTEKEDFEKIWAIFKEQKRTLFSLTDCSIISLMKERRIKDLATFDKEFDKVENLRVLRD